MKAVKMVGGHVCKFPERSPKCWFYLPLFCFPPISARVSSAVKAAVCWVAGASACWSSGGREPRRTRSFCLAWARRSSISPSPLPEICSALLTLTTVSLSLSVRGGNTLDSSLWMGNRDLELAKNRKRLTNTWFFSSTPPHMSPDPSFSKLFLWRYKAK